MLLPGPDREGNTSLRLVRKDRVDFGAGQARRWADEQAGEIMRVADFRAWMVERALTQEAAASTLGLSRRMIAYYLSGEKVIPKTVLLATEGWAGRVEA